METAKAFENERSQVVWQTLMDGLNSFTEDIFADGRGQGVQEEREPL